MRRHGIPSGRGGWTRGVALLAVIAMVATLGYSALVTVAEPSWLVLVLVALVIGLPIALLLRGEGRS